MQELFVKTDFHEIGEKDEGISWERDPLKHREVAKKLRPAFSARSIKAMEPTLQKHIDRFINQMRKYGGGKKGLELLMVRHHLSQLAKPVVICDL